MIDPSSPIRRHIKWKMALTKKTGFIGGAGVTGFLCRPWTSGCTDCCHWATRTPQSCVCCWSRCDDQAILWTCSMNLPHFFLHGSRRHRAADSTNQGPAGGVDHKKVTPHLMLSFS
ncbi:hypothetical protein GmHk_01G000746 [Glycine max]|nr:hypothetical protein GmHk_01G000746 [Glycine max]